MTMGFGARGYCKYQRFGGTRRLYLQGRKSPPANKSVISWLTDCQSGLFIRIFSTPKMDNIILYFGILLYCAF
jgi:hypothetical protein